MTRYPGVILPENLLEIYPKEMMVVLQHRFYDLEVNEKHFSVSLSFNGSVKRLVIPFASIVTFTDPSTQFGLQFKDMNLEVKDIASGKHDHTLESTPIVKSSKKSVKKGVIEDHKIVSLEQFKKKKYKA